MQLTLEEPLDCNTHKYAYLRSIWGSYVHSLIAIIKIEPFITSLVVHSSNLIYYIHKARRKCTTSRYHALCYSYNHSTIVS